MYMYTPDQENDAHETSRPPGRIGHQLKTKLTRRAPPASGVNLGGSAARGLGRVVKYRVGWWDGNDPNPGLSLSFYYFIIYVFFSYFNSHISKFKFRYEFQILI
jgi:hypothetical protein